ncbi:hypothetical protein D3C73_1036010 [compost metagenome]
MAGDAVRPGELAKQAKHAVFITLHGGAEFGIGALEVGLGDHRRSAMAGTGNENHVQVVLFDQSIQMGIDQVQPGRRPPMAQQPRLDVRQGQGLFE